MRVKKIAFYNKVPRRGSFVAASTTVTLLSMGEIFLTHLKFNSNRVRKRWLNRSSMLSAISFTGLGVSACHNDAAFQVLVGDYSKMTV